MSESSLGQIQGWMLGRLLGDASASALPAAMILADDRASAETRLAVYTRGYVQRLLECLRAEFPALRGMVGDQVFDLFARGYLAARPSRSYSLYELGGDFAGHLLATVPSPAAEPLDYLPYDLARLERARVESHRAFGLEDDPHDGSLAGPALLMTPGARIRLPPTVRLLQLSYPLADAVHAVDRGERPLIPEPRTALYAVARSHYRVQVHELSAGPFTFLQACANGVDVQAALAQAARACGQAVDELWAELLVWSAWALEAGLLAEKR